MPKFIARGWSTKKWEMEVEAETEHEAWEKAYASWTDDDVWDMDTDVEIEELNQDKDEE